MTRQRTFWTTIITGLILAGFPLLAIARHSYIQDQDVHFEVQSSVSPRADVENFDIWSDINMLDLSELSGSDAFLRGQTVYVHMSKGPQRIAYPFAVTSEPPENPEASVFAIRGKVTGREGDTLIVRYNFETFLPPNDLRSVIRLAPNQPAKTVLAVNNQGMARLVSVEVDGKSYAYRKLSVPELNGLTQ